MESIVDLEARPCAEGASAGVVWVRHAAYSPGSQVKTRNSQRCASPVSDAPGKSFLKYRLRNLTGEMP